MLLVLLVVELLYTVQVSFREHKLLPEPFLLVPRNGEYWSSAQLQRRAAAVRYVLDDDAHLDPEAAALTARVRAMLPRLGFRRVFEKDGVRVGRR